MQCQLQTVVQPLKTKKTIEQKQKTTTTRPSHERKKRQSDYSKYHLCGERDAAFFSDFSTRGIRQWQFSKLPAVREGVKAENRKKRKKKVQNRQERQAREVLVQVVVTWYQVREMINVTRHEKEERKKKTRQATTAVITGGHS